MASFHRLWSVNDGGRREWLRSSAFEDRVNAKGLERWRKDFNDQPSNDKLYDSLIDAMFNGDPRRFLTDAETIDRVNTASENIVTAYNLLKEIVQRHEVTIQRRWLKKSKAQRQKILLQAWGSDMNRTSRPDVAAVLALGTRQEVPLSKLRTRFQWPSINLEDLCKPRSLLLLLHDRAYHYPTEFAWEDIEFLMYPHSLLFRQTFAKREDFKILRGRPGDPSPYMPSFGDSGGSDQLDVKWIPEREGFALLKIQEKMLPFLLSCVKLILHDLSGNELLTAPSSQPVLLSSLPDSPGVSWTQIANEAYYNMLGCPDLCRMYTVISARREAALDHFLSMREDPSYFMATALGRHRDHILPLHGIVPINKSDGPVDKWLEDAALEMLIAWSEFRTWNQVDLCFKAFYEAKGDVLDAWKESNPMAILVALHSLKDVLRNAIMVWIDCLYYTWRHSKLAEQYFTVRELTNDPIRSRIFELIGVIVNECEGEPEPNWMMIIMTNVRELHHILETHSEQSSYISSANEMYLADLGILSQVARPVFSRDGPTTWPGFPGRSAPEVQAAIEFEEGFSWSLLAFPTEQYEKLCDHLRLHGIDQTSFQYPIEKPRTRERVQLMRRSERNLDLLWADLERHMVPTLGDQDVALYRDHKHDIIRTEPWREPPDVVNVQSSTSLDQKILDFELRFRTESTILNDDNVVSSKSKPKTRGTEHSTVKSQTSTSKVASPVLAPGLRTGPAIFRVDSRTLKVFKTIFYVPESGTTPGEISWKDFKHAMAMMGFGLEKIYGSVWLFSPTLPGMNRSINFHEPHPSGKIPYITARHHGRRLARAYGWQGDMFTLEDKSLRPSVTKRD